jgi:hypothetical protein
LAYALQLGKPTPPEVYNRDGGSGSRAAVFLLLLSVSGIPLQETQWFVPEEVRVDEPSA